VKRLIVAADDLGLHRGMTEGALLAFEKGVVTAVSISACGREVEHAIDSVRPHSRLDVGIHFTLVEERPLLSASEVPSLVGPDGRFPSSYRTLAVRWAMGRIDLNEVEAELGAQAERLISAGLTLTHANGHQHMHVLPGIIDVVLSVCRSRGINYVRTARDESPGVSGFGPRSVALRMMNLLGGRACRKIREAGLATSDRTLGIADAGHLTTESIARLLKGVREVSELVTHPGVKREEIAKEYDWGYSWDGETDALCGDRLRNLIDEHEIELCRPRDL